MTWDGQPPSSVREKTAIAACLFGMGIFFVVLALLPPTQRGDLSEIEGNLVRVERDDTLKVGRIRFWLDSPYRSYLLPLDHLGEVSGGHEAVLKSLREQVGSTVNVLYVDDAGGYRPVYGVSTQSHQIVPIEQVLEVTSRRPSGFAMSVPIALSLGSACYLVVIFKARREHAA